MNYCSSVWNKSVDGEADIDHLSRLKQFGLLLYRGEVSQGRPYEILEDY